MKHTQEWARLLDQTLRALLAHEGDEDEHVENALVYAKAITDALRTAYPESAARLDRADARARLSVYALIAR
jgi:predicted secreted Zn-dependent protease